MKGLPFSRAEKNFIWECRNDFTYAELASKVSAIFGTKRIAPTVRTLIWRRRGMEKLTQSKPVPAVPFVARNFKPEITNRRMVWAMTETNTSLFDIAAIAGLDIDHVRGLVAIGGIPKMYAKSVKDFYENMGVVL